MEEPPWTCLRFRTRRPGPSSVSRHRMGVRRGRLTAVGETVATANREPGIRFNRWDRATPDDDRGRSVNLRAIGTTDRIAPGRTTIAVASTRFDRPKYSGSGRATPDGRQAISTMFELTRCR